MVWLIMLYVVFCFVLFLVGIGFTAAHQLRAKRRSICDEYLADFSYPEFLGLGDPKDYNVVTVCEVLYYMIFCFVPGVNILILVALIMHVRGKL